MYSVYLPFLVVPTHVYTSVGKNEKKLKTRRTSTSVMFNYEFKYV